MENSGCVCTKHWFVGIACTRLGDGTVAAGKLLQDKFAAQKGLCPYTGKQLVPGINCWLDHIKPVSRFPDISGDINNVEWVDRNVNIAKGNMTKGEFLEMCRGVVGSYAYCDMAEKKEALQRLADQLGVPIEFP